MSHTQPFTGIKTWQVAEAERAEILRKIRQSHIHWEHMEHNLNVRLQGKEENKQTKNSPQQQKPPNKQPLQNQAKKNPIKKEFSPCQQLKQSLRFPHVIVSTPRHILIPFDELKDTGREQMLEKFNFYPYCIKMYHSYLNLLGKPPLCPVE